MQAYHLEWKDSNSPGEIERILPQLLAQAIWRYLCRQEQKCQ